jgi:hypothetical protein
MDIDEAWDDGEVHEAFMLLQGRKAPSCGSELLAPTAATS